MTTVRAVPKAAKAEPAVPTEVKIGAHRYKVLSDAAAWKDWEHEQKHSGHCGGSEHQRCEIYLNPAMNLSQRQDTLLHECLHAAWYNSGLQSSTKGVHDDLEEVCIVALTPWLHMLLNDNPKLVEYLTWQP